MDSNVRANVVTGSLGGGLLTSDFIEQIFIDSCVTAVDLPCMLWPPYKVQGVCACEIVSVK